MLGKISKKKTMWFGVFIIEGMCFFLLMYLVVFRFWQIKKKLLTLSNFTNVARKNQHFTLKNLFLSELAPTHLSSIIKSTVNKGEALNRDSHEDFQIKLLLISFRLYFISYMEENVIIFLTLEILSKR